MSREKEVRVIPFEAMSALEKDEYFGQYKDLNDEKKQFAKDYGEEKTIEGIFNVVANIMNAYNACGMLNKVQVLLCSKLVEREAGFVARHYKLELVVNQHLPLKEFFVVTKDNVEKLILSRSLQSRGGVLLGQGLHKLRKQKRGN